MIFLALAAGIFALEYVLKEHVNRTRIQGSSQEILDGRLILRNCHNKSFSWIFKNMDPKLGTELAGLALGGALWELLRQIFCKGSRLARLGLCMIVGGGAGNYAERRKRGAVTDYVSLGSKNQKIQDMAFNLSDLFIALGGLLWAASAWIPRKKR